MFFNRHKLFATKQSEDPTSSNGNQIAKIDVNTNQRSPLIDGISTARNETRLGMKRTSSPVNEDIKVLASRVNSSTKPMLSSQ
jgi:hypothetical protein